MVLVLTLVPACNGGWLEIADPVYDGDEPWTGTGSGDDESVVDEEESEEGPLDEESEGLLDEDSEGLLDEESDGDTGSENPVLVEPGGLWRYMTGDSIDPNWLTPEFDDRAWPSGAAPLGHGMEVTTEVPAADGQPTAWFRAEFELADPSMIEALDLRLRRDDGAIAHLNGVEVLRTNMPAGAIAASTRAATEAKNLDEHRYMRAFPDVALLQVGTNVLAVEIHDRQNNPEDRVIDALLQAVDPNQPPDELEFRVRTLGYDGKYGPKNVGAIWIETADGTFVRTLEVWGDTRLEHLLAWRTSSDENDVDAVTASTMSTHGTHVATWDLLDLEGQPVAPGGYRVRVEYTEVNSNDNDDPGPEITVAFELGGAPDRIEMGSGDADGFADLLLWAP